MGLGIPFEGTIYYVTETGYSTGSAGTGKANGWTISDKVYNVRFDWGDTFKGLRGISDPSICGYISTPSDPTLHIEWVEQSTASSLASYCVVRTSTGDLNSMCFELGLNTDGATKAYYMVTGAKCKTFNYKGNTGTEFICTADFSCCSITQNDSARLNAAQKIATDYAFFNRAGNVIAKATSTAIATIVDSIDITINNNLKDYWDHDGPYKQACIPGAVDISGTVGISLDDGGKTFADALYTEMTNITINSGLTTAYDVWTLYSVRWDNHSVEANTAGETIKTNAKFTAKSFTLA